MNDMRQRLIFAKNEMLEDLRKGPKPKMRLRGRSAEEERDETDEEYKMRCESFDRTKRGFLSYVNHVLAHLDKYED